MSSIFKRVMITQSKSLISTAPLVSVLVGCFNHSRFVVETLESLRMQTYPNLQLIIWDDNSQDDSVDLIQAWLGQHDIKGHFIRHANNLGICKSVNEALHFAQGKFIAMISADDVWLPDRIERQVNIMENSPDDVGVIYSDAIQIDEYGSLLPGMFIASCRPFDAPPEGFIFDTLWQGNFIPAMAAFIRTECFSQVGSYDEDLCFEDWDMWLRISRVFRFIFDPIPGAKVRILSTSMTRTRVEEMTKSIEHFKLKYYLKGWLSEEQGKDVAVALAGRFGMVANQKNEVWSYQNELELKKKEIHSLHLERQTHSVEFLAHRDEISKLQSEILAHRDEISKLKAIVQSAKDWQKNPFLTRTFHRWRGPGTSPVKIHPLIRLIGHFRKGIKRIRLPR